MESYLPLVLALVAIFSGPWILRKFGMPRRLSRSYPVWAAWILVVIVTGRTLWLGT